MLTRTLYLQTLHKELHSVCLWHKGKDMSAQSSDKALTDRMIQVGNIVGITLHDHVVISSRTEDYLSFVDVGLIDELRKSMAWVPKFEQVKKIKKMASEESEKKTRRSIAKDMKKKKLDVGLISQLTGLSLGEIEKL